MFRQQKGSVQTPSITYPTPEPKPTLASKTKKRTPTAALRLKKQEPKAILKGRKPVTALINKDDEFEKS